MASFSAALRLRRVGRTHPADAAAAETHGALFHAMTVLGGARAVSCVGMRSRSVLGDMWVAAQRPTAIDPAATAEPTVAVVTDFDRATAQLSFAQLGFEHWAPPATVTVACTALRSAAACAVFYTGAVDDEYDPQLCASLEAALAPGRLAVHVSTKLVVIVAPTLDELIDHTLRVLCAPSTLLSQVAPVAQNPATKPSAPTRDATPPTGSFRSRVQPIGGQGPPLYSGFLWRQSSIARTWKRRWVLYRRSSLLFYETAESSRAPDAKPLNQLLLDAPGDAFTVVPYAKGAPKFSRDYCFEFYQGARVVAVLSAESEHAYAQWLMHLSSYTTSLEQVQRRSTVGSSSGSVATVAPEIVFDEQCARDSFSPALAWQSYALADSFGVVSPPQMGEPSPVARVARTGFLYVLDDKASLGWRRQLLGLWGGTLWAVRRTGYHDLASVRGCTVQVTRAPVVHTSLRGEFYFELVGSDGDVAHFVAESEALGVEWMTALRAERDRGKDQRVAPRLAVLLADGDAAFVKAGYSGFRTGKQERWERVRLGLDRARSQLAVCRGGGPHDQTVALATCAVTLLPATAGAIVRLGDVAELRLASWSDAAAWASAIVLAKLQGRALEACATDTEIAVFAATAVQALWRGMVVRRILWAQARKQLVAGAAKVSLNALVPPVPAETLPLGFELSMRCVGTMRSFDSEFAQLTSILDTVTGSTESLPLATVAAATPTGAVLVAGTFLDIPPSNAAESEVEPRLMKWQARITNADLYSGVYSYVVDESARASSSWPSPETLTLWALLKDLPQRAQWLRTPVCAVLFSVDAQLGTGDEERPPLAALSRRVPLLGPRDVPQLYESLEVQPFRLPGIVVRHGGPSSSVARVLVLAGSMGAAMRLASQYMDAPPELQMPLPEIEATAEPGQPGPPPPAPALSAASGTTMTTTAGPMRNSEAPAIISGSLMKLGKVTKAWKQRHFILFEGDEVLYYYNSKKEMLPKGYIPLEYAAVAPSNRLLPSKKMHGFHLVTRKRTYVLAADTEIERDRWVAALVALTGDKKSSQNAGAGGGAGAGVGPGGRRASSARSRAKSLASELLHEMWHELPLAWPMRAVNAGSDEIRFAGFMQVSMGESLRAWKWRLCILVAGKLYLFKTLEDVWPVGVVGVRSNTTTVRPLEAGRVPKEHAFSLRTANRVVYLSAETQADMTRWIDAMLVESFAPAKAGYQNFSEERLKSKGVILTSMVHKTDGRGRTFRPRVCVVYPWRMFFLKSAGDESPVGSLSLLDEVEGVQRDSEGGDTTFRILSRTGGAHVFRVDSVHELERWIALVCRCCGDKGRSSEIIEHDLACLISDSVGGAGGGLVRAGFIFVWEARSQMWARRLVVIKSQMLYYVPSLQDPTSSRAFAMRDVKVRRFDRAQHGVEPAFLFGLELGDNVLEANVRDPVVRDGWILAVVQYKIAALRAAGQAAILTEQLGPGEIEIGAAILIQALLRGHIARRLVAHRRELRLVRQRIKDAPVLARLGRLYVHRSVGDMAARKALFAAQYVGSDGALRKARHEMRGAWSMAGLAGAPAATVALVVDGGILIEHRTAGGGARWSGVLHDFDQRAWRAYYSQGPDTAGEEPDFGLLWTALRDLPRGLGWKVWPQALVRVEFGPTHAGKTMVPADYREWKEVLETHAYFQRAIFVHKDATVVLGNSLGLIGEALGEMDDGGVHRTVATARWQAYEVRPSPGAAGSVVPIGDIERVMEEMALCVYHPPTEPTPITAEELREQMDQEWEMV